MSEVLVLVGAAEANHYWVQGGLAYFAPPICGSRGCLGRTIPGQKCMVMLIDPTNDFI